MKLFIIEDEVPIRQELTQFLKNMAFNVRAVTIFMA
jgi:DNA-binding response OmpR family regulator